MDLSDPVEGGGGGRGTPPAAQPAGMAVRALRLPLRYPLTLLWAVLMVVTKSGVLVNGPGLVSTVVYAIAAPVMIPAYVVGFSWLSLGAAIGIAEAVPRWFEAAGVLVVAAAYVVIDRAIRSFRLALAGGTPRR